MKLCVIYTNQSKQNYNATLVAISYQLLWQDLPSQTCNAAKAIAYVTPNLLKN